MGQRRGEWVGWLLVVCIDRAKRGAARLSFSLSYSLFSLCLFLSLSLSLTTHAHTHTHTHSAPRSAWTSIYLPRCFGRAPLFPLWTFSLFFLSASFPFNSLRANHPSLMSMSWSIGHCFCRSTNTDSELQTLRRTDTDLLDTLQPLRLSFLFSFSLSLSSMAKRLSDSINRGKPIVAAWIY